MLRFLPPLAVIFAAVLWSFDGFLRQSLYAAPSLLVVTIEHALGAILFLPLLVRSKGVLKGFSQQTWGSLLWVSLFGGILGTFFYTKALSYVGYIDLSVVVLLQKLQPFFAILLAAVVLRERLTRHFLFLALLAFTGGYLITFPGLRPVFASEGQNVIAALLAVGAAFCWGTSTVLGKYALSAAGFPVITALRLLLTAVFASLAALWMGQLPALAAFTPEQWRALLLIVVSTGAVALAIYYYGLKRVPASHSTIYELAWPLSAMLIDWFAFDRVLAPAQMVGSALLLGAMLLLPRLQREVLPSGAQA